MKSFVTIFLFTVFCSCNSMDSHNIGIAKKDSVIIDTTTGQHPVSITTSSHIFLNTQSFRKEDNPDYTTADFVFQDFSLSINHLVVYEDDQQKIQSEKDTLIVYAEAGYDDDTPIITVTTNHLLNLTIEQRYETSITVMNEGPHCDLKDWKHFYSDWKPLKSSNENQFLFINYTQKESETFPIVPIDELKKQIKQHCGDDYFILAANIKSPTEYPSGVSISRYFLRVTGQKNEGGETVTKVIVIELPMGC